MIDAAPIRWKGQTRLTGSEIGKRLIGNTMSGRHRWLIKWAMHYRTDGTSVGRFSFLGHRTGRWWLENDFWCAVWPMMNSGEPNRYVAFADGNQIKWFKTCGEEMASNRVLPGNPLEL